MKLSISKFKTRLIQFGLIVPILGGMVFLSYWDFLETKTNMVRSFEQLTESTAKEVNKLFYDFDRIVYQIDNSSSLTDLSKKEQIQKTKNLFDTELKKLPIVSTQYTAIRLIQNNTNIYNSNVIISNEINNMRYEELINGNIRMMLYFDENQALKDLQIKMRSILLMRMTVILLLGYCIDKWIKKRNNEETALITLLNELKESLKVKDTASFPEISESALKLLNKNDISPLINESKDILEKYNSLSVEIEKNEIKLLKQLDIIQNRTTLIDSKMLKSSEILKLINSLKIFLDQIVIIIDDRGNIIEVNDTFLRKLGYSQEECIGKNIQSFVKEAIEEIKDTEKLLLSENKQIFVNLKPQHYNGKNAEFVNLKSIEWQDNTILLIGKSIHEEITLQSKILRKNRELEYINQINTSLISNYGLNELLDNILKRIDALFDTVASSIYIKTSEDQWILRGNHNVLTPLDSDNLIDIDAYFGYEILSDTSIKNFNSKDQKIEFTKYAEGIKHLIFAPLNVKDEIIALMVIGSQNEMKPNDINILKMFKHQASIVIQRALLYDQLRKQYVNTIEALVNVIEAKDKYTEGHSRRVAKFSVAIAKAMELSNEDIENIEIAGVLHDVGKVGISESILNKRGKLTDLEYEMIKQHPEKGVQILKAIKLDSRIMDAILYHHVRYDLKGYPENHTCTELPIYAAIIGVADAFDAMTSKRFYVDTKDIDEAAVELARHSGTQFKPELVDIMLQIIERDRDKIQSIINDLRS